MREETAEIRKPMGTKGLKGSAEAADNKYSEVPASQEDRQGQVCGLE